MKVMAFIDWAGHMNVIDVSTPEKMRAYVQKCLKGSSDVDAREILYTVQDMDDIDEIFEYLAEGPLGDSFTLNHRGQGLTEVVDPLDDGFQAITPGD